MTSFDGHPADRDASHRSGFAFDTSDLSLKEIGDLIRAGKSNPTDIGEQELEPASACFNFNVNSLSLKELGELIGARKAADEKDHSSWRRFGRHWPAIKKTLAILNDVDIENETSFDKAPSVDHRAFAFPHGGLCDGLTEGLMFAAGDARFVSPDGSPAVAAIDGQQDEPERVEIWRKPASEIFRPAVSDDTIFRMGDPNWLEVLDFSDEDVVWLDQDEIDAIRSGKFTHETYQQHLKEQRK